ncbi:ankyrin repeat domain-containing protein [Streptomyces hokutonensis]|uniref:Ankyrin repeat domain-containing protein n=1 Tax=Streptomyces hokutonensis TaxID=1306990 RepID=A0ABW6M8N3_9ACTN
MNEGELHEAASFGMPMNVFEERIRAAADIDALWYGRTPLFEAVMYREREMALRLVSAGADPWRPQMNGWSPGRLNLAGPEPDLFGPAPSTVGLSEQEQAAVLRADRLIDVVADVDLDGMSIACVADISCAEATHRLQGQPVKIDNFNEWLMNPWAAGMTEDEVTDIVGATDVPGGCVVTQWAGYTASAPGVMALLTAGTAGYGMYANPKSGNQGSRFRDGVELDWDLRPGGGQAASDDPGDEILRSYLYLHNAIAYCCDAAGLAPDDPRAFTGLPDVVLRLPALELWPGHC